MIINDSPLLDWAHHTPKHSPTVFLGRAARGKLWARTSVHSILTNEAYTGTLVWGANAKDKGEPVRVEKAFPAIVTKAQFQLVGKRLSSRAPKFSHPRRVGSSYLLSGLVKCDACKMPLTGRFATAV